MRWKIGRFIVDRSIIRHAVSHITINYCNVPFLEGLITNSTNYYLITETLDIRPTFYRIQVCSTVYVFIINLNNKVYHLFHKKKFDLITNSFYIQVGSKL